MNTNFLFYAGQVYRDLLTPSLTNPIFFFKKNLC